jgi:hypothetical protein
MPSSSGLGDAARRTAHNAERANCPAHTEVISVIIRRYSDKTGASMENRSLCLAGCLDTGAGNDVLHYTCWEHRQERRTKRFIPGLSEEPGRCIGGVGNSLNILLQTIFDIQYI